MRVISGSARGTKLKTLSGTDVIRPTTDRVKESLFNIIQFDIQDSRILDVFCGSGALGIEALSRGALKCDFVDADANSLNIAKYNLKTTHLESKAAVHRTDFRSFFKQTSEKYDIIFADPPYNTGFLPIILEAVSKSKALTYGGKLIFETSIDTDDIETYNLKLYRTAVYGKTKILFYSDKEC